MSARCCFYANLLRLMKNGMATRGKGIPRDEDGNRRRGGGFVISRQGGRYCCLAALRWGVKGLPVSVPFTLKLLQSMVGLATGDQPTKARRYTHCLPPLSVAHTSTRLSTFPRWTWNSAYGKI